jgi:hypothetical protein
LAEASSLAAPCAGKAGQDEEERHSWLQIEVGGDRVRNGREAALRLLEASSPKSQLVSEGHASKDASCGLHSAGIE